MEYIIIGGDERFAHLARLLSERGERVTAVGRGEAYDWEAALRRAARAVVNCPPRYRGPGMTFGEILAMARPDARIYTCGPLHPVERDERLIDLWADEALLMENARLTAEGAAAAAMRAGSSCLRDMRCMVIGWGRIGRALTEILAGLNARVTVASRKSEHRSRAAERGAVAVETASIDAALPGHKLIVNTAPELVLGAAALAKADGDAMLIDLSSLPYGIDLRAAWALGLRAWREPGLPGRYCPHSAAQALLSAMDRQETEGGTRDE